MWLHRLKNEELKVNITFRPVIFRSSGNTLARKRKILFHTISEYLTWKNGNVLFVGVENALYVKVDNVPPNR